MSECGGLTVDGAVSDRPGGRSLVCLERRPAVGEPRAMAAFVTQLIACRDRIGIYREARRAPSGEAAAAYALAQSRV